MAFPPQSPDVNPIEHLWDELKREKVKLEVTSQDSLLDVLSFLHGGITFNHQHFKFLLNPCQKEFKLF